MALSDGIRERAKGLLARYRIDTNDPGLNIDNLLSWLNDRVNVHGIGLTTARCYRRWLAAYLENERHPQAAMIRNWIPPGSQEEALVADIVDAERLGSVMMVESVPTNSRWLSYIDARTKEKLIDDLTSSDSQGNPRLRSGPSAALMFTATLLTGLRPMEWPEARYLETYFDPETKLTLGPVLEVKTLKQAKRREDNPLREKRYLLLDEMPEREREIIKIFVGEAHAHGDAFHDFYGRCRKAISRAWKRVIQANPDLVLDAGAGSSSTPPSLGVSLYTARHIFAEEVRRSKNYTRFELAAMLGHTMLTNQVYYGPRDVSHERGYTHGLPRPWPGDAENIKMWDSKVNPLRFQYAQGDLFGGMAAEAERDAIDGVSAFFIR